MCAAGGARGERCAGTRESGSAAGMGTRSHRIMSSRRSGDSSESRCIQNARTSALSAADERVRLVRQAGRGTRRAPPRAAGASRAAARGRRAAAAATARAAGGGGHRGRTAAGRWRARGPAAAASCA
eukprot:scaffold165413_cov30-Tisochrysis_lutea.AAC.6